MSPGEHARWLRPKGGLMPQIGPDMIERALDALSAVLWGLVVLVAFALVGAVVWRWL
jgi:hypothetical protein